MDKTEIFAWVGFFIIVWLIIQIYGKVKRRRMIKDSVSAASSSMKSKGRVDTSLSKKRRYIAETIPVLLADYNVLYPSFYQRFSAEFLRSGKYIAVRSEDVVEGVEPGYAVWVYYHCQQIVSARAAAVYTIENAPTAEVKYIDFSVYRPNKKCPNVPKNKRYKVGDEIPIFPCADCKEENICIFWYKNVF